MDSRLKRQVVLITSFGVLMVLAIVGFANKDSFYKKKADVTREEVSVEAPAKTTDYYSWRNNEDFFDDEETTVANRILEEMNTLSMRVTSVERDIHIEVLGYDGEPYKDIPFEFVITGPEKNQEKEFVNKDESGLFIISGVEPGSYSVILKPVPGMNVPEVPSVVEVYDKVRYTKILDIRYKIYGESEVNEDMDDLMILTSLDESARNQYTEIGSFEKDSCYYGLTLSSDYENVDWQALYDGGVRFVILRAGYRGASSGKLVEDSKFKEYAKQAISHGLDVGAYFFTQAVNRVEAVEEASAVLTMAEDLNITYPIFIRCDSAGGMGRADNLDTEARTEVAEAFCETIKNAGYESGVYLSKNWLKTNLDADRIEQYTLWISDLKREPSVNDVFFDFWEYSVKGELPGIEGDVSLSIRYR
jgi:GH25 family lysozyme M1 (1,4-beta-N-acetylmuramidase)